MKHLLFVALGAMSLVLLLDRFIQFTREPMQNAEKVWYLSNGKLRQHIVRCDGGGLA